LDIQTKDFIALKKASTLPLFPSQSLEGGECAHLAKVVQTTLGLLDILGPFLDQAVAIFQGLTMRF
jgi:hypothetical protein